MTLSAPPSTLPHDHVTAELNSDGDKGLSAQEAARRLATHGPNKLQSAPPLPAWRRFLGQFNDPLIYLLFVAIFISLAAWGLEGFTGTPIDALVITIIVVANAVIGFGQEQRADDAVAALQTMTHAHSTVIRDGLEVEVDSTDLVVGDILTLHEGDAVGADARLLAATGLKVVEASLTGESASVTKDPAALSGHEGIGDQTNMVFKGTAITEGVGRAVIVATGMDTQMGSIATMLDETEQEDSPLTVEINHVSKVLGLVVIAIAIVVMAAVAWVNKVNSFEQFVDVLLLGVSLAVAAVPEGLPAILSVVLAIGVQQLARRNAVVKELHAVETLGSASVICSDKTGTLTKNNMAVEVIHTPSGSTSLSPVTTPDQAAYQEALHVIAAGAVANNASLSPAGPQGDPTEIAFLRAAEKFLETGDLINACQREAEVPFTSERKMMSTIERTKEGTYLLAKGGPEVLLDKCSYLRRNGAIEPLADHRQEILDAVSDLSDQAYRTLGVAYRELSAEAFDDSAEHDLVWLGVVGIIDPPRDEARQAITDAHSAGITVNMLTGDHPGTALRIASDLGIVTETAKVTTGVELSTFSDAQYSEVAKDTHVFARVAPEHKLKLVDALQDHGHIVAMTGDGVNDAPALKTADIGIAMGITGTEVTKQAARMVLADDNFATIVAAVRQGRIIFDNIKKFLRYLLSSNMGEVFTVFFGVLLASVIGLRPDPGSTTSIVAPLLATQILWINLVTDSFPALAMGIDPEVDDVMARKPRKLNDRIIDRRMWSRIFFVGAVMAMATLLTIDLFLPGGLIHGGDSFATARTAGFTALVLAQLFNAFNSRSETTSAFHRMFVNPWLWGAVLLGFLLQVAVVHLPFLQVAFGTVALDLQHWLVAIAMASSVLWADELRKIIYRLFHPKATAASLATNEA